MHLCCTVFGYAALMASFIPDSPSEQIIKISFTPRFFKSFNTPSQNLADSFSPIHIPHHHNETQMELHLIEVDYLCKILDTH